MEMYQWILRRKGYDVSDTGYFLYVDGQHTHEQGMIDSKNTTGTPKQISPKFQNRLLQPESCGEGFPTVTLP